MLVLTFCYLLISLFTVYSGEHECVKGIEVPLNTNYSDWPDLFRLTTPNPDYPTLPNNAGPVDPSVLLAAGVNYRFLDPSGYDYPNKTSEMPWNPPANGTNDLELQKIRNDNDFQYADIIVLTEFVDKFFEEHLHAEGDEVRYVLDGSGYFDIRDVNDEWVRVHAKSGDLMVVPAGIEHRFSVDEGLYIQAMRLFPGAPNWTSVPRSELEGNNTARKEYVDKYLCGIDPDLDHYSNHSHDHDISSHDSSSGSGLKLLFSLSSIVITTVFGVTTYM